MILPSKKWVPNNNLRWKEAAKIDLAHKEPWNSWGEAVSFNSDQTYIPHAGMDPERPYVRKANSLKLLLYFLAGGLRPPGPPPVICRRCFKGGNHGRGVHALYISLGLNNGQGHP